MRHSFVRQLEWAFTDKSDACSWDADGSLSSELELQHRDGDPNDQVRIASTATKPNMIEGRLRHYCGQTANFVC